MNTSFWDVVLITTTIVTAILIAAIIKERCFIAKSAKTQWVFLIAVITGVAVTIAALDHIPERNSWYFLFFVPSSILLFLIPAMATKGMKENIKRDLAQGKKYFTDNGITPNSERKPLHVMKTEEEDQNDLVHSMRQESQSDKIVA